MLSRPSNNFKINDTTKNLFLFFQCVNEMTFDYSPDTYKAPTLNTRLICREAYNTYKFLKESNALDKYYGNNSDYLQKARKYGHFTGYKN